MAYRKTKRLVRLEAKRSLLDPTRPYDARLARRFWQLQENRDTARADAESVFEAIDSLEEQREERSYLRAKANNWDSDVSRLTELSD
jgi:hypothetical protein